MKEDFLKSISLIENNFINIDKQYVEKWKRARISEFGNYYNEMFTLMKEHMDNITSVKVQIWLEICAYYFQYNSIKQNNIKQNIAPMEIDQL